MAEAMTGRDYYIQSGYDELPEAVRIEMRRVFDTGVNNSGVWVRYKEVENLAGVMAYEYTHRPAPAVVRCRECIHRPKRLEGHEDGDGFGLDFPDERCPCHCEDGWYSWMPPDDWFCANGERKRGGRDG